MAGLNINNLPAGSFSPIPNPATTQGSPPLNVNNLPAGSVTPAPSSNTNPLTGQPYPGGAFGSLFGKIGTAASSVLPNVIKTATPAGQAIAAITPMAQGEENQVLTAHVNAVNSLVNLVKTQRLQGKDVSKYAPMLDSMLKDTSTQANDLYPGLNYTPEQVLGSIIQTGTLALSGGAPEGIIEGASGGGIVGAAISGAKLGAGFGLAGGVGSGLSANESPAGVAKSGFEGELAGAGTGGVLGGAVAAVPEISDALHSSPNNLEAQQATALAAEKAKAEADWLKPVTAPELSTKSAYSDARDIVENSPNVGKTAISLGLNPYEHIENNLYDTEGSAKNIVKQNGIDSESFIQPALEKVDPITPKMPATDLLQPALDSLGQEPNITPTIKKAVTAKIKSMIGDIAHDYPEGLGLVDNLEEKINHDGNAGWNNGKSNDDNYTALANRSMGNALRGTLESRALEQGLDIKPFQKVLSDRYALADYLKAIHGTKAPVSMLQSVVRYGVKIGSAKIAGLLGGGGESLIGEIAGYKIGGAVEQLVENMTNPMRDAFLSKIKLEQPEEFTAMKNFIDSIQQKADNSIKLPAGTGADTRPIILPENKGGESSVVSVPAQKGRPFQNPTTGRMERSYTSDASNIQYVKDTKTGKVRIIQK